MDSYTRDLQGAIKRRLLRELEKESAGSSIVNNLYGGGSSEKQSGGIQDSMLSGQDPFDYYVDIARKSDPEDPKGWSKTVHRHRGKKE